MATLRAYQAFDNLSAGTGLTNIAKQGSDTYALTDGTTTLRFVGNDLTYNRYWPANGNVTGIEIDKAGAKVATLESTNFTFNYNNIYLTTFNDSQKVFPIALSGDDSIYGSAFDDKLGGFDGNDLISGGDGNDILSGGAGNDILIGGNGNNVIDGGTGLNTAVYSGLRASYSLTKGTSSFTVASSSGAINDQVTNVGRFSFSDGTLAFDEHAAQAFRIYEAAFHRVPDRDGVTYWVGRLDTDLKLSDVANYFLDSAEYKASHNATTNGQFIETLYQNVLERGSDQAGFDYWLNRLDHGTSRAEVLAFFSDSTESVAHNSASIAGGVWLNPDPLIM